MVEVVDMEYPTDPKFVDHGGEEINGIKILRYAGHNKRHCIAYECICPYCGDKFIALYGSITHRNLKSCGCYNKLREDAKKKYDDAIGKTFNYLKVNSYYREQRNGYERIMFDCKCTRCGNHHNAAASAVYGGYTKSCGCLSDGPKIRNIPEYDPSKYKIPETILSHIGEHHNSLKILDCKRNIDSPSRYNYYICQCDCGNIQHIRVDYVLSGSTKACSECLSEKVKKLRKQNATKHGLGNTRLYSIYRGMKERCYNANSTAYKNYGGRGIRICDEWLDKESGFLNFYNWAMSNGYSDDLSIDRIEVDGNYEASNCRWASRQVQVENRSNTIYITYEQKVADNRDAINRYTLTIPLWAKITGLSADIIRHRLRNSRDKWTVEQALTTKADKNDSTPIILNIAPYIDHTRPDKYEQSIHD